MYPPTGPPHPPSHTSQDQYPLNDTNYVEHRPVQSPFSDPYPLEQSYTVETHEPRMPIYDNQPLLQNNTMPMPYPENDYSVKPEVYNEHIEHVTPTYFTGAPSRQLRRYKTGKLWQVDIDKSIFTKY